MAEEGLAYDLAEKVAKAQGLAQDNSQYRERVEEIAKDLTIYAEEQIEAFNQYLESEVDQGQAALEALQGKRDGVSEKVEEHEQLVDEIVNLSSTQEDEAERFLGNIEGLLDEYEEKLEQQKSEWEEKVEELSETYDISEQQIKVNLEGFSDEIDKEKALRELIDQLEEEKGMGDAERNRRMWIGRFMFLPFWGSYKALEFSSRPVRNWASDNFGEYFTRD